MKTTKADYEGAELLAFSRQIKRIADAPLADRQSAARDWRERLSDPETIAVRADWILNGSYGHGAYLHAWHVARNRRMNRAAWFSQMVAALDFNCPADFARREFLRLSKAQQAAVNAAILTAVDSAVADADAEMARQAAESGVACE